MSGIDEGMMPGHVQPQRAEEDEPDATETLPPSGRPDEPDETEDGETDGDRIERDGDQPDEGRSHSSHRNP